MLEELTDRQAEEEVIDLRRYWYIIYQNKWDILGLAVVVALGVALVVFSIKPLYRATTTLLIESEEAKVVSIEEIYGVNTKDQEYYRTQYEILRSRELAEDVIDRLGLDNYPEFAPKKTSGFLGINWRKWMPFTGVKGVRSEELERHQVVSNYRKKLSIQPVRKTQLVNIHFDSLDPRLSALIANTVAEAYIESHLAARKEVTRRATEWLTESMDQLKIRLDESEERLQSFREREGLVDVQGVRSLITRELNEITSHLVNARNSRTQAENAYRQVRKVGPDSYESIPSVLRHPLMQQLKAEEARAAQKVAELKERYGSLHPAMIAALSEYDSSRSNLSRQIDTMVAGIRADYEVARATEESLLESLNRAKKEIQAINRKEFELRELEREVETKRKLYDTFFNRFQETTATDNLQAVNARVVDPAVTPVRVFKPRKGLAIMLALIISTVVGVVLAFLLEHLNDSLKGPDEVEGKLGQPLMGTLPLLNLKPGEENRLIRAFLDENKSSFSEAVRTVRTGLMLSGLDTPHKTTVVTSTVSGEGKTTLAINLALALGSMEKVLLVDADMRRPSLAKACGISTRDPGLSNLVAGTGTLSECIHRFEEGNIDVIPAGVIPPNPLELLSSQRFREVIAELGDKYDQVVIDTAPTHLVSDALVLANMVDVLLYVVRADSTSLKLVRSGISRCIRSGAPLTGVVLNQTDMRRAAQYGGYYGNYYGGYYGNYYGYDEDEAESGKKKDVA